jgi:hypothetical protein
VRSQTWTQAMFAATQNNYRQKSVPESTLQQRFEYSNDNIFQPKFAEMKFNMQATKCKKSGSISLPESKVMIIQIGNKKHISDRKTTKKFINKS